MDPHRRAAQPRNNAGLADLASASSVSSPSQPLSATLDSSDSNPTDPNHGNASLQPIHTAAILHSPVDPSAQQQHGRQSLIASDTADHASMAPAAAAAAAATASSHSSHDRLNNTSTANYSHSHINNSRQQQSGIPSAHPPATAASASRAPLSLFDLVATTDEQEDSYHAVAQSQPQPQPLPSSSVSSASASLPRPRFHEQPATDRDSRRLRHAQQPNERLESGAGVASRVHGQPLDPAADPASVAAAAAGVTHASQQQQQQWFHRSHRHRHSQHTQQSRPDTAPGTAADTAAAPVRPSESLRPAAMDTHSAVSATSASLSGSAVPVQPHYGHHHHHDHHSHSHSHGHVYAPPYQQHYYPHHHPAHHHHHPHSYYQHPQTHSQPPASAPLEVAGPLGPLGPPRGSHETRQQQPQQQRTAEPDDDSATQPLTDKKMRGQQPRWSRLSIACDYCHSKKIRCLGPIGSCPNCVSRKLVCRFDRSLRPKKTAEYVAVLQAEINRLELAIRARSQRPPAGSGGLARHGTAASASASASAWDPASHGRSCTLSSRARDRDTHAHAHAPTRGVMRPSSPRSSQMHLAAIRSAFGMADQTDADVHPTTAASASSSASAAGPASAPGHPDAYPLVPPPSIRLDLLERWFTYVMPKQSGVVLPSWFFMNLDSHPPLLLNAMYAHGMLFPLQPSSLPSSLVSSREPATATATATATISRRFDGDMFYEAAKSYLIGALQTVSLPNILGLLLMGNYARDTGRVEGLVIVAAAARLMQLYMHQKSLVSQSGPAGVQEVDEQTEELTRRLWWSLYESSVQVAIVNNIPGDAFSDIYRPSLPHGSLWDARHGSNDMGGDVRQSRHRHRHRHRHDHGTIFWHSDRHRDQSDNQQQQQEQQEQGHGRYLQLRKLARIQPLMTPYSARMVLLEIFDRVLQFRWIEKECWLQIRQQLKLQQSRGNQKPSLTLADQARLDELESQRWALDRELLKWLNQLPPEWRVVAPAYRCLITVDEVRSVIQRYTAGAASRPSAGGARDTLTTATDDASDTGPSKRLSVDESGAGDAGRRAKRPRHDDAAATAASTAPLDHASPSSENSESSDSSDSSDSSSSDKPPLAWPFAFLLACYHYSRLVLHGSQMRQDQSYTPQLPVEQGIETSQSICLESSGCIMQIVKVFLEQNPDFAEVTPIMSKLIFEAGTAVVSGIKKGVLERDAGVGQVRMAMDALARIGREFAVVAHGMDELSRMLDHVLAGPEDASDSDGSRRSSLQ